MSRKRTSPRVCMISLTRPDWDYPQSLCFQLMPTIAPRYFVGKAIRCAFTTDTEMQALVPLRVRAEDAGDGTLLRAIPMTQDWRRL